MPLGEQIRVQHATIAAANPLDDNIGSGLIVATWDGIMDPVLDESIPNISSYHINGSHSMDIGSPSLVFVVASVVIVKQGEITFATQEYSRTVYNPGLTISYTDAAGTTSRLVHGDLIYNDTDDFFSTSYRGFSGSYGFTPQGRTLLEVSFRAGFGTSMAYTDVQDAYWYGTTAAFVSYS